MLTIRSSVSSASASRSPFGVESTGLPATVKSARMRPSPGVRISSAMHEAGSSPNTSPRPLTRAAQRWTCVPRPRPGSPAVFDDPLTGVVNIAPPGRSRSPIRTLITSISQLASVPNACVVVPIRP